MLAYLHRYASVPGRLSLFNRCNGSDTYAKSGALSRQFIDAEILGKLKLKYTKQQLDLIDSDKQDDIYLKRIASDGSTVLTHMSFKTRDYTGEKSDTLIDSLVVSAEEELFAMSALDSGIVSLSAFEHSPLDNMISDTNATALNDCGEYVYELSQVSNLCDWFASAGARTVKSLLYMLLTSKKGEDIYAVYPASHITSRAHGVFGAVLLEYFNKLTAVLPAYVRRRITFAVGYMPGDTFKGCMLKMRALEGFTMPEGVCNAVLLTKDANYVNDIDAYYAVEHMLDYLCSLYSNERARHYFAEFSYRVSSSVDEYAEFDSARFFDLVKCFGCIDNEQSMSDVMGDIKQVGVVLRTFLTVKSVLTEHEKLTMLALLMQYAELKAEPPSDILPKLFGAYKDETLPCRALIIRALDAMLEAGVAGKQIIAFFDSIAADEVEVNKLRIRNALKSVTKGKYATAAAEVYKRLFIADNDSSINAELFADLAVPCSGRKLAKNIEVLTHILPTLKQNGFAEMLDVFKTFLSGRSAAASAYISAIAAKYDALYDDECRALFDAAVFDIYIKDAQKGVYRIMTAIESGNAGLFDIYAKRFFDDKALHQYIDGTLTAVFGEDVTHIAAVGTRLMTIVGDNSKAMLKKIGSLSVKSINACYRKQTAFACIEAYRIYSDFIAAYPEFAENIDTVCDKALFKVINYTLPLLINGEYDLCEIETVLSKSAAINTVAESRQFITVSAAVDTARLLSAHDAKGALAKALELDVCRDIAPFIKCRFDFECNTVCHGREGALYAVYYYTLTALDGKNEPDFFDISDKAFYSVSVSEYYFEQNMLIDAAYQKELKKRAAYAKKHRLSADSVEIPARQNVPEPVCDSKQFLHYKQKAAEYVLLAMLDMCVFTVATPNARYLAAKAKSALELICDEVSKLTSVSQSDIKKYRLADHDIDRITKEHLKQSGFLPSLFGKK